MRVRRFRRGRQPPQSKARVEAPAPLHHSVRPQQAPWVNAVDISHERRMDRIADQLAGALRQLARYFSGDGECHVLELAPPRCHSVPLVIASDPDGMISLTASALLPSS